MSICKIIRMGHPTLRLIAKPVESFDTSELNELIISLFDTMQSVGGIGLAAPQINVSKRVIVFGSDEPLNLPQTKYIPKTALINPNYEIIDNTMLANWESCFSVPGLRGLVRRYKKIHYWGYTQSGDYLEREVEGWHSIIFQHEYDHLNGILFPQRLDDITKFGFTDEVNEFLKPQLLSISNEI